MSITGDKEEYRLLNELYYMPKRVKVKMLESAAQVIVPAHKESIRIEELIDTGSLIESIAPGKVYEKKDGSLAIDIYPHGTDASGTRNAEKGFVNEYGSSIHDATHWMEKANDKKENEARDAIERVYNDYLDGILKR